MIRGAVTWTPTTLHDLAVSYGVRCQRGKRCYSTVQDAQRVMSRMLDQNPADAGHLHPYYCHACRSWHIGHKRRRHHG